MGFNAIRSRRRRALGIGMTAAVATAIAFPLALTMAGASASDDLVTVTTAVAGDSPRVDQSEILSDGHVTDAEMRETLDRVAQCVGEAGYQVDLIELLPGLGWDIGISLETDADAERASAVLNACSSVHAEAMDQYESQSRLTPAEQQQFDALVRECLVANGVELDEIPGAKHAVSVPLLYGNQLSECQEHAIERVR